MRTPLKILLVLGGLLVVGLAALAIAVAVIFDSDDYRPVLVNAVERSTGRDFDIQGDLGLKLFPCCGISMGRSILGNPAGFPAGPFAEVDTATLSLKIWPLLVRREIQIGTVTLEGMELSLLRLADGRANWTFEDSQVPAEGSKASEASLGDLTIAGLYLRDGRVSYRDLGAGTGYSASDIQLETGTIGDDLEFDIRGSFTATDEASAPAVDVTLAAALAVAGDLGTLTAKDLQATMRVRGLTALSTDLLGQARIPDLHLDVEALSGNVKSAELDLQMSDLLVRITGSGDFDPAGARMAGDFQLPAAALRQLLASLSDEPYRPADPSALTSLSGSGRWELQPDSLRLQDVNVQLDDTRLTGNGAIENFETTAINFDVRADRIDLDRYLDTTTEIDSAAVPAEPTSIPFADLVDLKLAGKLGVERLRASAIDYSNVALTIDSTGREASVALAGRALGGSFSLTGNGDITAAAPFLAGTMTLTGLSPRALLTALDEAPVTADPQVLADLTGKSQWRLGPRFVVFEQMSLQLDATRIAGNLRIDDFDRPTTRFDLSLDRLNLDAYLEPDSDDPDEPESEIPVEIIRDLTGSGRLLARELTIFKVKLLNVTSDVTAANGVLRLAPLRAGVFGGEYTGDVTIDATGSRAKLSVDQQVSAVQVGELLRIFYDTDRLAGALSMQLKASGTGNTQTQLLKALSGDVSLNLSDGAYRGMDLMYEVRNARALLRRETPPPAPDRSETPIRALTVSGRLLDGVLRSDDLKAATAFLQLTGNGGVNLLEQSLEYQLIANVLRNPQGNGSADLTDLLDVDIPLTIKGPMMKPRVGVDLKNLATTVVREKVKERARDALLERLGDGRKAPQTPPPEPDTPPPAAAPADAPQVEPQPGPPQQESPKDLLKRGLRDLLKAPSQPVEPVENRDPPP